ncbi:MAG TPA: hypothetical protein VHQ43_01370 [Solirubrobacterales bacterium]|nr:hypothetical protein [Solirubrobacterales bacterium]
MTALAICAVAAASASAHEFHSETNPTVLTGDSSPLEPVTFTLPGLTLECSKSHAHATVSANPTTEVTIEPSYKECHFGKTEATINLHGCATVMTSTTINEDAPIHVECPKNEKIEISIPAINCTLKIPAQTPAGGVHYNSYGEKSSRDFEVTATVEGIIYEKIGGFACELIGTGEDAALDGAFTIKGYEDKGGLPGNQIGVWVG